MKWSSFRYLFGQGLHAMRLNRMMTVTSVGVLTVCMVITGCAGLLSANLTSMMEWLGRQNEMVVMLDRSATEEEYLELGEEICAIPGVSEAAYHTKQEALNELSAEMEGYASLFEDLSGEENPLYARYTVSVSEPEQMEAIGEQISGMPLVEVVRSPQLLVDTFLRLQRTVRAVSWGLVALLGIVSVVVIGNTIRLTVFARRREITIMKYVGATNAFIRLPFFVEGVTVGVLAGLLSSGLVLGAYAALADRAAGMLQGMEFMGPDMVLPLTAVWPLVLGGFLLFGILLGSLGTTLSMRKYLNV